jgi:hypothetical protein
MSFIDYYLRKPAPEVTFDDLQRLVSAEVPESQTLEYKSGRIDLAECGETISAFLNTDGGLLVIGAPQTENVQEPGGRRRRICRGQFRPINPIPDKDDAHRKLLSRILPLPAGVTIRVVPTAVDSAILLVDVPKSSYPPHQFENSYFVRLDGETRKAPQALVEALFLQRRGPNLQCNVVAENVRPIESIDQDDRFEVTLRINVVNNSRSIAEFFALDLKVDKAMETANPGLAVEDSQAGDIFLNPVAETDWKVAYRYRLTGWVLHAYSSKVFRCSYRVRKAASGERYFRVQIDLQAKDMLLRRYDFRVDLLRRYRHETLEPVSFDTVGET